MVTEDAVRQSSQLILDCFRVARAMVEWRPEDDQLKHSIAIQWVGLDKFLSAAEGLPWDIWELFLVNHVDPRCAHLIAYYFAIDVSEAFHDACTEAGISIDESAIQPQGSGSARRVFNTGEIAGGLNAILARIRSVERPHFSTVIIC